MKAMTIKLAAVLMFCSVSFSAYALGREVSYDELFNTHAGSITRITTCGSWQLNNRAGKFRVIEAYFYGQNFLYIDRVAINADQTGMDVVGKVSVVEFNNDHAELDITKLSSKPMKNAVQLQLNASSGYKASVKKIKIQVRADDTYSASGF
jgi:hypothetical protein